LEFTATSSNTLISLQGLSSDQYVGLDQVAVEPAKDAPAISAQVNGFVGAMAALGGGGMGALHSSVFESPRMMSLTRPRVAAS
jgi:hypothetical protein